jgi:putative membrane protein
MTTDTTTRRATAAILAVSLAATAFLFWLIYVHPAADAANARFAFLPLLNAVFNAASAIAICLGLVFIRSGQKTKHGVAMLAAFSFSTAFLVGYILHHALHGDVLYPHNAPYRVLYLTLLVSHIALSMVALPMVLTTFFLALSSRFAHHRTLARWTYPVWLYVSITGVITFVMLRLARG